MENLVPNIGEEKEPLISKITYLGDYEDISPFDIARLMMEMGKLSIVSFLKFISFSSKEKDEEKLWEYLKENQIQS